MDRNYELVKQRNNNRNKGRKQHRQAINEDQQTKLCLTWHINRKAIQFGRYSNSYQ